MTVRWIPPGWTADPALRVSFAITLVLIALTSVLGLSMLGLKLRTQRALRRDHRFRPAIVETLTAITLGTKQADSLASIYRLAPVVVANVLVEILSMQKGAGQLRLAETAERLGIVDFWRKQAISRNPDERCRAVTCLGFLPAGSVSAELRESLDDPEELVSVVASRGLTREARVEEVNAVFESLPRHSTLVRALISPSLRRHSVMLATFALPHALTSTERGPALAALELIRDWQRALPADALVPLLQHPDDRIREFAFLALPFALGAQPSIQDFEAGIDSECAAVRRAALNVAARLRRTDLDERIAARVSDPDPDVAFAAAAALASRGNIAQLEQVVVSGKAGTAAAMEAIERFRVGRLTC